MNSHNFKTKIGKTPLFCSFDQFLDSCTLNKIKAEKNHISEIENYAEKYVQLC